MTANLPFCTRSPVFPGVRPTVGRPLPPGPQKAPKGSSRPAALLFAGGLPAGGGGETAAFDGLCDETVKLSKIFAKPLDTGEGWNIINLALGNIEC